MRLLAFCLMFILGSVLLSCKNAKSDTSPPASGAAQNETQADPRSTEIGLSQPQIDAAMNQALKIDPQRCWGYIKQFVAIGSRPLGSAGHKRAEDFIHAHLKGDQVEDDAFSQSTPQGSFPVRNIIAKYPGKKPGIVVFASHYETNIWLPKTYVGANDGGSSTGLLLEFASLFREKVKNGPMDGHTVWLVFTDGEEAMQRDWSSDSLYGSKHLAEKWQQDGTSKQIKALLLADMIGDADLNIDQDANSSVRLQMIAFAAASHYGYQSHFYGRQTAIEDDHLPFRNVGIPVMDFIDLDYGYNNSFHHTPEDTLDKLSPKSLEISGNAMLGTLALLNAGAK
ncbi:MAG TPA: M28 family peptidase [Terriglobales bacterium]|jgi:glutaminyl-peptide cyclotransferase|nr:M28 family peptidase [Terriglobales bacterium]